MKKGEEHWLRRDGELARVRVNGTTQHGVAVEWLDGTMKGRVALIEKSLFAKMQADAKGGRGVT